MTTQDAVSLLSARCLTPNAPMNREIQGVLACDLLSHAMAHACKGAAWVTVRSQMTVVAIAAMYGVACVILADGVEMDPQVSVKAEAEGIAVLQSPMTAYEICGRLYRLGIGASART